MKLLVCPICGERQQVDDKAKKVICAECLITKEAPLGGDGVQSYSREAFLKLVSVGIDDWKVTGDKEAEEKKLAEEFNILRKKYDSLVKVKRKLNVPWRKAKKLEGLRLLKEGWSRKNIAKELKVDPSTVSRWKKLQKKATDDLLPTEEEKMQHSDSEVVSGSPSSDAKNQGEPKLKVQYKYSAKTLRIVKEETGEI